MYRIGVDLGGTNIAVGVVSENLEIVGRGSVKTKAPRPAADIFDDIKVAVDLAMADAGITADEVISVGVGTPGTVNKNTGYIEFANNLDFQQVPAKEMLEEIYASLKVIDLLLNEEYEVSESPAVGDSITELLTAKQEVVDVMLAID